MDLGFKIKELRKNNKLTQTELADKLYVSEKTISSWEQNRTKPDLDMIYKLADYFKVSFYYFICEYDSFKTNKEIQIKLKLDKNEYERLLNHIIKIGKFNEKTKQIDTYYETNKNSWLRIRNENGKYLLNYKKKLDDNSNEKYDVYIDNYNNLNMIITDLGLKKIGNVTKNRIKYFVNEIEFLFDDVDNFGYFIEIKKYVTDIDKNLNDIFDILKTFHIDFNLIDNNRYIDYLRSEEIEKI